MFKWQKLYYPNDVRHVPMQADLFFAVIRDILNKHAPLYRAMLKNNDRPWINEYFKQLVTRRNELSRMVLDFYTENFVTKLIVLAKT
jgi:hypothetical protein